MASKICIACGNLLSDITRRGKFCFTCQKYANKVYRQNGRRRKEGKEAYTPEQVVELVRYFSRRDKGLNVKPPDFYQCEEHEDSVLKHRCQYCGRKTANVDYCTRCKYEGYHFIHLETGITNGWDKHIRKQKGLPEIKPWIGSSNFYKTYTRSTDETR